MVIIYSYIYIYLFVDAAQDFSVSFVFERMARRSVSLSDDDDWLWEPTTVAATPSKGPQLRHLRDPPQQRRSASSSISVSSKRWRRRREATPEIDSADARVAEVDKNRNQDNAPPLKRRNYGKGLLQVVPTGHGNENQMDRPAASSSSAVAAPGKRSHGMRGAAVAAPQWRRLAKQEPGPVRLQTALGDQGPDTSLRSFNPKID